MAQMDTNINIKEKSKIKILPPKNYKAVMFNDDFTTMEFVVEILVTIFHKSIEEATKIMLDVHNKGKGVAGIYSYDIAKTKVNHALRLAKEYGFPFKMAVEEE